MALPSEPPTPVRPRELFIAYSRADLSLLQQLEVHLAPLSRRGSITPWTDRKLIAGDSWNDVILARHRAAEIYLILVSPDFIATDYCFEVELRGALERRARGEAIVVPIILRPCDWQATPLGDIQALPSKGRPIVQWDDRDLAWLDVIGGLRALLEGPRVEATLDGGSDWVVQRVDVGSTSTLILDKYGVSSPAGGTVQITSRPRTPSSGMTLMITTTLGHIRRVSTPGRGGREISISDQAALHAPHDLVWGDYDIRVTREHQTWCIRASNRHTDRCVQIKMIQDE